MNGKKGDHPLTDLLVHKIPVYTISIDNLIVEISKLVSYDRLYDMFNWYSLPSLPEFEQQLKDILKQFKEDAKERGWEIK